MRWAELKLISGSKCSSSLLSDDSGRHKKVYSDVLFIVHVTNKVLVRYTKLCEVLFWVTMSSYGTL